MELPAPWPQVIALAAVALIGAFVGGTDLMRKYKDSPARALATPPARLYIAFNVVASVLALGLIWAFDWRFERTGATQVLVTQVLVAGVSAMVLFRSAVFTVSHGGAEVSYGPASILQTILDTTDRGVDRIRAEDRAKRVADRMQNISFDKASLELPLVALALMQNLSEDEQELLEKQVNALITDTNQAVSNEGKCLALGLLLLTFVGDKVLEEAVEAVKPQIAQGPMIHAIDPESIDTTTLNGSETAVTISGQNFASGTRVRLNGEEKPTTVIGPNLLTVKLTAADLAAPGDYQLTVYTPQANDSESAAKRLAVTTA